MAQFKVAERFVSINGESARAGELAVFIRFAGCNLNCGYCDTKWANEKDTEYELLSDEELISYIKRTEIKNVTLTGGEPLIQEDIDELLLKLSLEEDIRVEVETNGSIDIAEFKAVADGISYTLDYKLPGSGCEDNMCISTYGLDVKTRVYISPVFGSIELEDIVDYMIENNMNDVKLQLQMHKIIWDPETRGV